MLADYCTNDVPNNKEKQERYYMYDKMSLLSVPHHMPM